MSASDEAARLQHMISTGQGSEEARRQAADRLAELQRPARAQPYDDYDLETAGGTEAGGGPWG